MTEDASTQTITVEMGSIRVQTGATTAPLPWETDELAALQAAAFEELDHPTADLEQLEVPPENLELLPREIIDKYLVLPFRVESDRICLAMANPANDRLVDELSFVTGKRVERFVSDARTLQQAIDRASHRRSLAERPRPFRVAPSRNSSRAFASAVVTPD